MFIVRNILNSNNLDDYFPYNITPGEITKWRHVMYKVVSVNIKTY